MTKTNEIGDPVKVCSMCGNDIDKINRWKSHFIVSHNFITGEDEKLYICDRCYKNKISKYIKISA